MVEEDNIFTLCSFCLRLLDILMDVLPSKVDRQAYQNQNMRQLNQKLLLLEQELREMKAEMLKGKRQNEEPSEDATGKKNSHGEIQVVFSNSLSCF
ncbi:hypothetical protein LOK49_LG08G01120 [Camellia lanceoleosa]|uniref:Uncharacterized protein n=1 Tax=Camellia lanceoleosa TaxID=1840588 RepID=A0ACC0GVC0_9ERIC|nr:hypothetical protein LOK49_LG08G01120 [Camellia lanceoleosa]